MNSVYRIIDLFVITVWSFAVVTVQIDADKMHRSSLNGHVDYLYYFVLGCE